MWHVEPSSHRRDVAGTGRGKLGRTGNEVGVEMRFKREGHAVGSGGGDEWRRVARGIDRNRRAATLGSRHVGCVAQPRFEDDVDAHPKNT